MSAPAPASFGRNTAHESSSPTAAYARADQLSNHELAAIGSGRFGEVDEEEAWLSNKSTDQSGWSPHSMTPRISSKALALAGFSRFGGAPSTSSEFELDEDSCAEALRPWRRTTWYNFAIVVVCNICLVVLSILIAMPYPEVLALSVVAYFRGICRGFDVSHIAVVSGVLRLLLLHGLGWPAGVGLWFSLGNSAVVVAVAGEAFATRGLEASRQRIFITTSRAASTCATTAALYSFGMLNVQLAVKLMMSYSGQDPDSEQERNGFRRHFNFKDWVRCSVQSVRLVDSQWKIFLTGMLFGLSSASAAAVAPSKAEIHEIGGLDSPKAVPPPWSLLPPLAFTGGLALADALSCLLTLESYGWAMRDPVYTIGYNAVVTVVPAAAAFLTGIRDSTALLLLLLRTPGKESWITSWLSDLHPGELPGVFLGVSLMVAMISTLLSSVLAFKCWPYLRRYREARSAGFQPSVELCMEASDQRDEEVFASIGMSARPVRDPELDPLAWS